MAIRIGPLRLLRLRMDRRIHSWGPKPLGELTIGLDLNPAGVRPPMRAHGSCLPESCLFGLDSGREVHLTLPKEVELGLVVIPRDTLCNWADQLGCGGFDLQGACRRNLLLVDPLRCEGLRAYLRQIFSLVASDPGRLEQPLSQKLILEDLLPLLLEALIHGADQAGLKAGRCQAAAPGVQLQRGPPTALPHWTSARTRRRRDRGGRQPRSRRRRLSLQGGCWDSSCVRRLGVQHGAADRDCSR
jgi:hypothetical protein